MAIPSSPKIFPPLAIKSSIYAPFRCSYVHGFSKLQHCEKGKTCSTIIMEEMQKKLQTEADTLRQIHKEYNKVLSQRRQLDGQLNENIMVKEELELLKEDNDVFKLIGPVLVKQDLYEAKQNVDKRIDYIKAELNRVDGLMSTLDKKLDSQKDIIDKLQRAFQQAQIKSSINQPKS